MLFHLVFFLFGDGLLPDQGRRSFTSVNIVVTGEQPLFWGGSSSRGSCLAGRCSSLCSNLTGKCFTLNSNLIRQSSSPAWWWSLSSRLITGLPRWRSCATQSWGRLLLHLPLQHCVNHWNGKSKSFPASWKAEQKTNRNSVNQQRYIRLPEVLFFTWNKGPEIAKCHPDQCKAPSTPHRYPNRTATRGRPCN